ncbi:hypothetical protein [Streptomyces mirabilis]
MGTTGDAAGGWWNTPQGRLFAVAPIGGYTSASGANAPSPS